MVETMERAEVLGQSVKMTRVIKASRERVFEAWTNPRSMMKWFGTPTTTVLGVTMDPRVGGQYVIETTGGSEQQTVMRVEGIFTEIVPVERVAFTWNAGWAPGERTLVTVSLREVSDGTEMTLEHSGFMSEPSKSAHQRGWEFSVETLARLVEAG